jgi:periplasmic divalent cation tolerance protein
MLVEVLTTVAREADAEELARRLVRERLAACASVSACRSFYQWKGALAEEREWEVRLKTLEGVAPALERRLRELHPYEVPAVLRIAIDAADPAYVAWVAASVAPAGAGGKP